MGGWVGGSTYLGKHQDLCVKREDLLYFLVPERAARAPGFDDAFDWVGGWVV